MKKEEGSRTKETKGGVEKRLKGKKKAIQLTARETVQKLIRK